MKRSNNLSIGLVVVVILISFIATTYISVRTVYNTVQTNEKKMAESFAQNVYDAIEGELQKPVIAGRAIVNTETLIELLINEDKYSISELEEIFKSYLITYKAPLDYSTVSIISNKTGHYYTQYGFNKTIDPLNDEHDIWYTYFLDQNVEHAFDIDVDEVNGNAWTLFMNIRINDYDGNLLGVSGIGMDMTYLQDIISELESIYDIEVYFVDRDGKLQLGSDETGVSERILNTSQNSDNSSTILTSIFDGKYQVSRPIRELGWELVIERDNNFKALTLSIVKNNLVVMFILLGLVVLLVVILLSRNQHGLIRDREEARKASEAKGQFLASMSHEIRTPINGILGMDAMLLKVCTEEKQIEYAKNIQSAGKTLLSIVNDILDISKIESGKMQIFDEEYAIFDVLNDCYNMNISRVQQKGLKFTMDINPELPSRMLGDSIRIRQLINNLLSNAAKYTPSGEIKMSVFTEDKADKDVNLKIIVSDTGVGIKPEDLSKLFDSFTRIEEEKNRNIEGTGLGLNLCRHLVHLMNGSIDVKSVYGEGSTFTVIIPQKVVDSAPMGSFVTRYHENLLKVEHKELHLYAPTARILVVDDVSMNLAVVEGFLEGTGIQVDTSTSGKEGLAKLNESEYDVVFLDHLMPGMDGVQTLKQWQLQEKVYNKNTPIIMLTANAISGAKEEYMSAGFSDYLSKPLSESDLKSMLLKYINKDKLVDEKKAAKKMSAADKSKKATSEDDVKLFAELRKINELDLDAGLVNVNNNKDFYLRVLREFVNTEKAKEIERQYKDKNIENYGHLVHGLKNLAGTLGFKQLGASLGALEDLAVRFQVAEIEKQHGETFKLYYELVDKLATIL